MVGVVVAPPAQVAAEVVHVGVEVHVAVASLMAIGSRKSARAARPRETRARAAGSEMRSERATSAYGSSSTIRSWTASRTLSESCASASPRSRLTSSRPARCLDLLEQLRRRRWALQPELAQRALLGLAAAVVERELALGDRVQPARRLGFGLAAVAAARGHGLRERLRPQVQRDLGVRRAAHQEHEQRVPVPCVEGIDIHRRNSCTGQRECDTGGHPLAMVRLANPLTGATRAFEHGPLWGILWVCPRPFSSSTTTPGSAAPPARCWKPTASRSWARAPRAAKASPPPSGCAPISSCSTSASRTSTASRSPGGCAPGAARRSC